MSFRAELPGESPLGSSAATAYLNTSVRQRPNLTILLGTLCTRVILSKTGSGELVCTGAEFATESNGPRTRINAQKEVILCSGSIGTPQILMCSGIGPENALEGAGILVELINEHVGRNLIDVSLISALTSF
jgi:choline dehydrogenase